MTQSWTLSDLPEMSFVRLSSCLLLFTATSAFTGPPLITVNFGDNATLPCQAPSSVVITVLEWTRTDLSQDDYVFFYRNDRSYEKYQHESFRGRVVLNDPKMTNGEVSVVLKSVDMGDEGTYVCRVTVSNTERFSTTISLKVSEPGLTLRVAKEGKTDKVFKDEGNKDVNVGLVVGVVVALVVCVVAVIVGLKYNDRLKQTLYQVVSRADASQQV